MRRRAASGEAARGGLEWSCRLSGAVPPVKESPAGKTSLISSSFRNFHFSGMKISGISAARRRIPPGCGCAVAKDCTGDMRLLREARLKVARGRLAAREAWSMPPGVGVLEIRAWEPAGAGDSGYFPRGIVCHAENSGMTMLFFSWRLLRCREVC